MTAGGPDEPGAADLVDRVAGGALGWLDARRDRFRLPADIAEPGVDVDRTLKPLGELAELAGLIASVHPGAELRARAADLFAFAWAQTADGAVFAELLRAEPHATYPVEIYGVFARAGLRHPDTDALVDALTRPLSWRVPRSDPTRSLGVRNAEDRTRGGESDVWQADFAADYARTWLGLLPEPWALDRRAAYGLTHDVFHVTDWGRHRGRLPAEAAGYLRLWLPAWLDCWLDERSWDLAGELLAVAACVDAADTAASVEITAAWRRLAAAQDADGGLPETGTEPRPDDPAADFLACYHSTLVAAFAATLARTAPVPALVATEAAR